MSPTRLSSVTIGIETLRANLLRTALSTLGIIVGSASLVAVLALGDGLQRYGRQQIEQTTDLQSVVLQPRTSVFIDGQVFPVDGYPVFGAAEAARGLPPSRPTIPRWPADPSRPVRAPGRGRA